MSYILEALRKADAERERGAVPDLHAQLPPPGGTPLQDEAPRASLLPWLAVGALLALVAGGAWQLLRRDAPVVVAAAGPATLPAVTAAASAASAAPPLAALPAPAPGPAPASAPTPAATPAPAPAAAARPVRPPAAARPTPATRPAAKRVEKAVPAPDNKVEPPPAPPPSRLPALAELPAELRQQVPPLAVGGSVYSPQPSARMVIVNGQVFQEGSSLAPELKLEQIRQKTAVFSIRGTRFELPL